MYIDVWLGKCLSTPGHGNQGVQGNTQSSSADTAALGTHSRKL